LVNGLALFRDRFAEHRERYVLIGGAACDLALGAAGVGFRATKDLDIVLRVEASDTAFAEAFWAFVDDGGYESREASPREPRLYRFQRPADATYPAMLELFSGRPGVLEPRPGATMTPIPFDGEVASLSAILLDDAYAAWIQDGRTDVEGVPILSATHLIPLKARAWLDLNHRHETGGRVDRADIKKHRNDVFRLGSVIDPTARLQMSETIREDLRVFLAEVEPQTVDLKAMGLGAMTMAAFTAMLRDVYGMDQAAPQ
jgi:hypothetical protein